MWGLIDGIGYGGLGFGLGVASVWNGGSGYGEDLATVGISTLTGTVLGAVIGTRAQRTIAAGRSMDRAHGIAVIGGAVAAGGVLGALTSAALISGDGNRAGTVLGSDEETLTKLVLAGGVLGSFYVLMHRDEFRSRSIEVGPEMTRNAEYGLRVVVTF